MDGELDVATASELATVAPSTGDLIVDVSELRFVDAAGLRTLIALRETVQAAGGSFRLRGSCAALARVLDILQGDFAT